MTTNGSAKKTCNQPFEIDYLWPFIYPSIFQLLIYTSDNWYEYHIWESAHQLSNFWFIEQCRNINFPKRIPNMQWISKLHHTCQNFHASNPLSSFKNINDISQPSNNGLLIFNSRGVRVGLFGWIGKSLSILQLNIAYNCRLRFVCRHMWTTRIEGSTLVPNQKPETTILPTSLLV